jgi:hypothetical protein
VASKLSFNKDQILDRVRAAELGGLIETGQAIVNTAKGTVAEDSGDLKRSLKVQGSPKTNGNNLTTLEVGSDEPNIGYAAIQELGPATARKYTYKPYLRPALDKEGPNLAENIKKRLGF